MRPPLAKTLFAFAIAAAAVACGPARADMSNPLYQSGKAALARDDFKSALRDLQAYLRQDAAYLQRDVGLRRVVQNAISYSAGQVEQAATIHARGEVELDEATPQVARPRLP